MIVDLEVLVAPFVSFWDPFLEVFVDLIVPVQLARASAVIHKTFFNFCWDTLIVDDNLRKIVTFLHYCYGFIPTRGQLGDEVSVFLTLVQCLPVCAKSLLSQENLRLHPHQVTEIFVVLC